MAAFLRAVNPESGEDEKLLLQMRIACGWHANQVKQWMDDIREKKRLIWFIVADNRDSLDPIISNAKQSTNEKAVGMTALILEDDHHEEISLSRHRSVELSSLFVYTQERAGGFGRFGFRAAEEQAKNIGAVKCIIKTHSHGYLVSVYERMGYKATRIDPDAFREDYLAVGIEPVAEHCSATYMEKLL